MALVEKTGISASAAGFVGVLDDGCWYPNEARAKEEEENSKGEDEEGVRREGGQVRLSEDRSPQPQPQMLPRDRRRTIWVKF